MTYVEFIEHVRRANVNYVKILEDFRKGKASSEEVDVVFKKVAQDVARAIKAFEADREEDSRDIHLCPVCNRIIHKEGQEDEAEFPERVGQSMEFWKDVWQSYEGYRCYLCGYNGTYKIEHWE